MSTMNAVNCENSVQRRRVVFGRCSISNRLLLVLAVFMTFCLNGCDGRSRKHTSGNTWTCKPNKHTATQKGSEMFIPQSLPTRIKYNDSVFWDTQKRGIERLRDVIEDYRRLACERVNDNDTCSVNNVRQQLHDTQSHNESVNSGTTTANVQKRGEGRGRKRTARIKTKVVLLTEYYLMLRRLQAWLKSIRQAERDFANSTSNLHIYNLLPGDDYLMLPLNTINDVTQSIQLSVNDIRNRLEDLTIETGNKSTCYSPMYNVWNLTVRTVRRLHYFRFEEITACRVPPSTSKIDSFACWTAINFRVERLVNFFRFVERRFKKIESDLNSGSSTPTTKQSSSNVRVREAAPRRNPHTKAHARRTFRPSS